ncbi:hypothetical protein JCM16303_005095 [Sporobolomyces ruberrimus]
MFALKAVTRLVPTSSQVAISRTSVARYLSTDAPSENVDIHTQQGKERARSIRKVSEEGGAHSASIALAVKNTAARADRPPVSKEQRKEQAKRQFARKKPDQTKAGSSPTQSSRPRTNDSNEPQQSQKPAGGLSTSDSLSLLRGNAKQRPFNPRFPPSSSLSGDRSSRPPRFNSPSSSSSSSPKSKQQQKGSNGPKLKRRERSASSPSSIFSAEDTKPLAPPPQVSYPSINLAQLLRADLAAKALQVKHSVSKAELNEDSEDPKVREQARKVLSGDYSQWSRGEKGEKGEAVQHASTLLSRNASVGLEGREVFINKLKEVL